MNSVLCHGKRSRHGVPLSALLIGRLEPCVIENSDFTILQPVHHLDITSTGVLLAGTKSPSFCYFSRLWPCHHVSGCRMILLLPSACLRLVSHPLDKSASCPSIRSNSLLCTLSPTHQSRLLWRLYRAMRQAKLG